MDDLPSVAKKKSGRRREEQGVIAKEFIDSLPFLTLSSLHREILDIPVQKTEIPQAIESLQPNRVEEPSGFSVEFYKEFTSSLVKELQAVF